ncbi:hypothetical protein [Rhodopila sp.]|uniref:hypothetical protein n=1 Tax=Rhodopila sp. TaxID=2480087 RepID=UPI003D12339E
MQIQPSLFPSPVTNLYPSLKTGTAIDLDTTLTSGDKAMLSAVYGSNWQTQAGPNGNIKTNPLADAIAISRAMGTLKGPVTAQFLRSMPAAQPWERALSRRR